MTYISVLSLISLRQLFIIYPHILLIGKVYLGHKKCFILMSNEKFIANGKIQNFGNLFITFL